MTLYDSIHANIMEQATKDVEKYTQRVASTILWSFITFLILLVFDTSMAFIWYEPYYFADMLLLVPFYLIYLFFWVKWMDATTVYMTDISG